MFALFQLFIDVHGALPIDFTSRSEYVKSLRSKALQADAKVVLILQLEEVRLSSALYYCRMFYKFTFMMIFCSFKWI